MLTNIATYVTPVSTALWWIFIMYAAVAAIFIILENKSPEKTIAWVLCFLLLPVIGVLLYFIFGQDHHGFSRRRKLLQQTLRNHVMSSPPVAELLSHQRETMEQLEHTGAPIYGPILNLMRRTARAVLFPHNSVEILQNASQKYPRLLEDLRAAQHSIHMEYFEWASDEFMQEVKQILLERAKAGVEVRVLYDTLGCFSMLSRSYVREMNAGGAHMLAWSPLYAIHTLSYRSHRKIVIIDGKIGYTGGINMSEEYLKGPHNGRFTGWRDTHMRVTGQVVWGLQASFAVQWYNTTKKELFAPIYYPACEEEAGYVPLQIVHSGPDADWRAIREFYFALITSARKHIYIQSPFFILDEGLAEALAGAARTGVDVRIMIAPRGPGPGLPYWAGLTYAENLAETGVKIYLYQGEYFHAKTISIDSVLCSIGSANMDIRSFSINYELNLIIYDEKTTQQLERDFHTDLKHCQPFDLKRYRRTNGFKRARDSISRLFSPLL